LVTVVFSFLVGLRTYQHPLIGEPMYPTKPYNCKGIRKTPMNELNTDFSQMKCSCSTKGYLKRFIACAVVQCVGSEHVAPIKYDIAFTDGLQKTQ